MHVRSLERAGSGDEGIEDGNCDRVSALFALLSPCSARVFRVVLCVVRVAASTFGAGASLAILLRGIGGVPAVRERAITGL